jgi:hypothetical protein
VTLVRRLLADERMQRFAPTAEQLGMIENMAEVLQVQPAAGRRKAVARKAPARKASRAAAAGRRKSR